MQAMLRGYAMGYVQAWMGGGEVGKGRNTQISLGKGALPPGPQWSGQ